MQDCRSQARAVPETVFSALVHHDDVGATLRTSPRRFSVVTTLDLHSEG